MRQRRIQLWFDTIDLLLTDWMARSGLALLRLSVGLVFLWFGALKLFPGLSPAEQLIHTALPFLPMGLFLPLLGIWEIAIGLGLITGKWMRLTLLLLFLELPGTLSPALLAPTHVWTSFPFGLTLEGEYIIKGLVLITVGLVIGSTVRGGGIVHDPVALVEAREQQLSHNFISSKS